MAYYDLGQYGRPVTTKSADAQVWFDRGLVWCYGYNHEESVRCFRKAAECDPSCAMAYWGVSYATGPNYNKQWKAFDPIDLRRSLAQPMMLPGGHSNLWTAQAPLSKR